MCALLDCRESTPEACAPMLLSRWLTLVLNTAKFVGVTILPIPAVGKILSMLATAGIVPGLILRLTDWLGPFTWKRIIIGVLLIIVTFVVSTSVVSFVVVKLPATYFHPSHDRDLWSDRHRAIRWTGIIIKNLGGLILVLVGIAMSLPGVPGPGVLTILFGIMLLDFPGKRRLEYKLVSQPKVLKAINQLREKFDKPPMEL